MHFSKNTADQYFLIYCSWNNKVFWRQFPRRRGSCRCFYLLIYLFLDVLGLGCCVSFRLVVASRGYSTVAVCELPVAVATLVAERGL